MQVQLRAADSRDYPRRQVLAQNRCQNGHLGADLWVTVLTPDKVPAGGPRGPAEVHGPPLTMGQPSTTAAACRLTRDRGISKHSRCTGTGRTR